MIIDSHDRQLIYEALIYRYKMALSEEELTKACDNNQTLETEMKEKRRKALSDLKRLIYIFKP